VVGPRTDWDQAAEWYDGLVADQGSEYHQKVVLPGVVRLLRARPGDRVLDVACGQGVLCRLMAEKGVQVTGVDASRKLIALARRRGDQGVRYLIADARSLDRISELREGFVAATCVLAIQNIHPLQDVVSGIASCLVDGGRVVVVMNHPAFRGPKATSWGWDEKGKVQYRRVDRYLIPRKEPIVTHPGDQGSEYTWSFHRPMQAYVRALSRAGLWVDAMEEWASHKVSTSGPRAGAENVSRKEIPLFLAIRAVKISGAKGEAVESDESDSDTGRPVG
jgi:ubiquinone/menaquinone biosynthesis C-methylase UbiE